MTHPDHTPVLLQLRAAGLFLFGLLFAAMAMFNKPDPRAR